MGMDLQTYLERFNDLTGLVSGNLAQDVLAPAAAQIVAEVKQRIFVEGRDSQDKAIGQYSTKPLYASKDQFVKGGFNAQGKNNKFGNTIGDRLVPTVRTKSTSVTKNPAKYQRYTTVKPDYTERKTMYLKEGYKELREVQGLQAEYVDLSYSGALEDSYDYAQTDNAVVIGIKDEKNSLKRQGMESHFNANIFFASNEEIENAGKLTAFLLRRIVRNTLEGTELEPYTLNTIIA